MPPIKFQPCIPTRGTKVPSGPDWLHEIKHDGHRLIVQRESNRVRLLTRRGYDWSDRYPLITFLREIRRKAFWEFWEFCNTIGTTDVCDGVVQCLLSGQRADMEPDAHEVRFWTHFGHGPPWVKL